MVKEEWHVDLGEKTGLAVQFAHCFILTHSHTPSDLSSTCISFLHFCQFFFRFTSFRLMCKCDQTEIHDSSEMKKVRLQQYCYFAHVQELWVSNGLNVVAARKLVKDKISTFIFLIRDKTS